MISLDQTVNGPNEVVVFQGEQCIGSGSLAGLVSSIKAAAQSDPSKTILIFDRLTSKTVDFDFHGPVELIQQSLAPDTTSACEHRGPGRPKLGVVAREITLLPRHWDWLNGQPGGASVALRKLVEEACRTHSQQDQLRLAQESAYRFMNAMAGNHAGYEEALRALYSGDKQRFAQHIESWPTDIAKHAASLAAQVFQNQPAAQA